MGRADGDATPRRVADGGPPTVLGPTDAAESDPVGGGGQGSAERAAACEVTLGCWLSGANVFVASTAPERILVGVDRALIAHEFGHRAMFTEEIEHALNAARGFHWENAPSAIIALR